MLATGRADSLGIRVQKNFWGCLGAVSHPTGLRKLGLEEGNDARGQQFVSSRAWGTEYVEENWELGVNTRYIVAGRSTYSTSRYSHRYRAWLMALPLMTVGWRLLARG